MVDMCHPSEGLVISYKEAAPHASSPRKIRPKARQMKNNKMYRKKTVRQTERHTDRQTGRQTDRQVGRQRDRQTDRQTDQQYGNQLPILHYRIREYVRELNVPFNYVN